jgi:mono/diheme cytochrome c family protein
MNTIPHSINCNCTAAVLLLAFSLAIVSPASRAAEAPAATGTPSQPAKGPSGTKVVPGGQPGQSVEQALELREILRTADAFDPLDWDNRLADLARAARRFPTDEEVAKSLFRALGPKPQILSPEFDPADGHVLHMVVQNTLVRTDDPLAPIPDWVLEFAEAQAGELGLNRTVAIQKRVHDSSATDPWTRQAKSAIAEQISVASALTSSDPAANWLGWETYTKTCVFCHGPDGRGNFGQAPPLAGSDWVLAAQPNRLIRIALNGLRGPVKVRGKAFDKALCPPLGEQMSDLEVAATLTFMRSNRAWGHALSPVSAAEVKTVRDAPQPRHGPWTADELLNLPPAGHDANPQPVDKPSQNNTRVAPSTKPNEYE